MSSITYRPATLDAVSQIADIYNYYIRDTIITFEEVEIDADEIARRIQNVAALGLPWWVAEETNLSNEKTILGYTYAAPFRERAAYRYSVETAVYLRPETLQRGIGTQLYQRLFEQLRQRKLHRAFAGISLPNDLSVRLHERFGFKYVGTFTESGKKFDQWIDVGFWELDLSNKMTNERSAI